jgi:hypothetical protein
MAATVGDWDGEPHAFAEDVTVTRKLSRLLEEARWERILRRHGLSTDE